MGFLRAGINFELKSRKNSGSLLFIHGLFMGSYIMYPMAKRLNRCGFHCFGYDYPTRIRRVSEHGKELAEILSSKFYEPKFNIVTHSMGGLILRSAVAQRPELAERIERVVMIAPPNRGSDVALGWLNRLSFADKLVVPLPDLSSGKDSAVHTLPLLPASIELGILAADNDGAVRLEYTYLGTERDHKVLPGAHTDILFRRETADCVEGFLRNGKFIFQV